MGLDYRHEESGDIEMVWLDIKYEENNGQERVDQS